MSLAKVLHEQYTAALHEYDSDEEEEGAADNDSGDAGGTQQVAAPGRASAERSLEALHQRCVQVVMELVSADEGNWDYLLL